MLDTSNNLVYSPLTMTNTNTTTANKVLFVADYYYDRRHRTPAIDQPAFCGRVPKVKGKPAKKWGEVFDGLSETAQRNCGKCARAAALLSR